VALNDKFTYTYDFGDHWPHHVRVEKSFQLEHFDQGQVNELVYQL